MIASGEAGKSTHAEPRSTRSLRWRLIDLLRPHRGLFLVCVIAGTIGGIFQPATVFVLTTLLGVLFPGQENMSSTTHMPDWLTNLLGTLSGSGTSHQQANRLILVLVAVLIIKNIANYCAAYVSVLIQEGMVGDLRARLYAHLLRLDLGVFQRTRGGHLTANLISEADQVKMVMVAVFAAFFQNMVLIVSSLYGMLAISPRMTGIVLVLAPFLVLTVSFLRRRLRGHTRAFVHERAMLMAMATEKLAAIKLIRASSAEKSELSSFTQRAGGYQRGIIRTQRFALLTAPVGEVFGGILIVTILMLATDSGLSAKDISGFLLLAVGLMTPVKALSQVPVQFAIAEASGERIFEVLDIPETENDPADAKTATFTKDLAFDHVTFGYDPATPVLSDINLSVQKGELVALVGPSGAGKTTLLDLLPRFYEPTRGEIRLDGAPLVSLTRSSLRSQIAVVSQETVVFHDTVRANIAYGRAGATEGEIVAAARAANAHEFIEQLPEGYNTILGERGTRLSGGQRQRISIARALLRDAPILILDEATSALDTESERLVQEAIDRLVVDRTVLVIAHRLATVRSADRIVVMDQGRIVESGTHEELLQRGGLYRRLHDLQFSVEEGRT